MPDPPHLCRQWPCPYDKSWCGYSGYTGGWSEYSIGRKAAGQRTVSILNDTTQAILLERPGVEVMRAVFPKTSWRLEYYSSYKEFIVTPNANEGYHPLVFTSDDLKIANEITVYETPQNVLEWRISKANPYVQSDNPKLQELATFDAMRRDASSRMEMIVKLCEDLEKSLEQAKVCRAQCTNLVQKYVEGIKKMKEIYFDPSLKNLTNMWLLYNSLKLKQLISSLEKLVSTFGYAKDLVQACDKEWVRMSLILSSPMAPPGKNAQHSKFDLLVDEFNWNLDTIQYILLHLTGDVELKWNETLCRYALVIKSVGHVAEVAATHVMETVESVRLVRKDREDLLLRLQNGSFVADHKKRWLQEMCRRKVEVAGASESQEGVAGVSSEEVASLLEKRWRELYVKILAVVKKRLQEVAYFPTDSLSVPECFWIIYEDLIYKRRLSKGGYKVVYTGDWLGQEVAIGSMEEYDNLREIIEKEALIMLKVQHPNIVDFLACAFTDEAVVERNGIRDTCKAGCFVMEYIEEDLWKLRLRLAKAQGIHSAVVVDILLQIAEAMLYMHNRGIMHRDLKAGNCLVKPRSSSPELSSQALRFYTVKLIDFGTSKVIDETTKGVKHTTNQGTRPWMAPEVCGPPGPGKTEYTKKADVFSFGMTCYEVITGLTPLQGYSNGDVESALYEGKRPSFPASVSCPEGLKQLMAKCWAQKPDDRPSFEEIRKDLWTIKYDLEFQ